MTTHEPEAVVRALCERYAACDADGMAALFADDGVYHNVPKEPLVGRGAVHDYLRAVFAHVVVEAEILHLACNGEWVLSERLDTHVIGERRMPLPVMNISRVVDGRLVLWRDYYDTDQCRTLGLL